ncbi:hotdog fold thioesterase [Spongiibacter taiwanensis]|uniref:hotdog fold thioesterase n=1 Tax=Spongiibacter taiwanensis TaxID=1748242 RepID=UPI0020354967|nr:hotdog fold thioesterase [Spongiibacter taiwanensis]USA42951.1 hotdog fold thioesterase [Spongiibacter taiwanensis]
MAIWRRECSAEELNVQMRNTLAETLDIRIEEVGDDFIAGSMVVDKRTHQPYGILHGGASVALAETLGSVAASMCCAPGFGCVGLDINANHIRAVTTGRVYGKATAAHVGRTTQVWEITLENEEGKKVCVSRLTMAVIPRP